MLGRRSRGGAAVRGTCGMNELSQASDPAGLRMTKSSGASNALTDVTFEVAHGQVHALVGENGAGKSTLVKIVTGILEPDAGEIALNGETVRFATPIEARRAGVAAVYQDPSFFPISTLQKT